MTAFPRALRHSKNHASPDGWSVISVTSYRAANAAVRKEVLGAHAPALTIIITGIYDEEWLLEIEAIAAA